MITFVVWLSALETLLGANLTTEERVWAEIIYNQRRTPRWAYMRYLIQANILKE